MKNKAAQQLGKRGGKARAAALSKEQRSAIATNAAHSRWRIIWLVFHDDDGAFTAAFSSERLAKDYIARHAEFAHYTVEYSLDSE